MTERPGLFRSWPEAVLILGLASVVGLGLWLLLALAVAIVLDLPPIPPVAP